MARYPDNDHSNQQAECDVVVLMCMEKGVL